jgi:hypothetical protein
MLPGSGRAGWFCTARTGADAKKRATPPLHWAVPLLSRLHEQRQAHGDVAWYHRGAHNAKSTKQANELQNNNKKEFFREIT